MLIAINPGHFPGLDPGARGDYSDEAWVVEAIAKIVCADIEAAGYGSIFIQHNELWEIYDEANDSGADLFVSIHCNAFNGQARGTETFYYEEGDLSHALATCVQERLVELLGTIDRGTKDGSHLAVIRRTDMPAILTEVGFIDNLAEEQTINNNKEEIGHAIARGIFAYLEEAGA